MTKQHSRKGLLKTTQFMKGTGSEDWISQAEAARVRGVSPQAIAKLVKKGRLQVLKIGGKVLLNRSEVQLFEPERPGRPRK